MKSFHLILSLIIFLTFSVNAQKNYYGGFGYGSFAFGSIATKNINSLVGLNQNISANAVSGGGGGFAYFSRFVIGGSGNGASGSTFTSNGVDYNITHGWGGLEAGYDFSNNVKNKITATFMIGGRGTNINILNGNDKDKSISNGSALVGINLYLLRFLVSNKTDDDGGIGGFMLGFKAGAWMGLESSKWEFEGNLPLNRVSYTPYGVNIGITIGGGGFGYKKK
ncbi:MAG: hypothetical protein ACK4K9_08005 [Bacteroidia bacterium]